jgi:ribosomal protein S12 methylthiotransferase accessory factor YcaO
MASRNLYTSDKAFARRHGGMTTKQLTDAAIKTAEQHTPQEKEAVRSQLWMSPWQIFMKRNREAYLAEVAAQDAVFLWQCGIVPLDPMAQAPGES